MGFRWPIEIDGLPFLEMGGSFHGYVSHNQMVILISWNCRKSWHAKLISHNIPIDLIFITIAIDELLLIDLILISYP